jgi:hypothetical protein
MKRDRNEPASPEEKPRQFFAGASFCSGDNRR